MFNEENNIACEEREEDKVGNRNQALAKKGKIQQCQEHIYLHFTMKCLEKLTIIEKYFDT